MFSSSFLGGWGWFSKSWVTTVFGLFTLQVCFTCYVGLCLKPLTPKLILPSSCYTFSCKHVTRIWCYLKVATSIWQVWVFLLPVCWIMYRYYREKLLVNHFWRLTTVIVLSQSSLVLSYFVAVFCENFSNCLFGLENKLQ